jgi:hypothetical protein
MTVQIPLRPAILASALALCSLVGCFGPGDDKGDDAKAPNQAIPDASKTGGLGENRGSVLPPPGPIDARNDSKPPSEPK